MCLTSVPLVCKVNIEVSWKLLRVSIFDAEEFPNFIFCFFLGSQWYELSPDTALVREIIPFETWLQRHGSQERGQVWKCIAESVDQIQEITFKVASYNHGQNNWNVY